MNDMAQALKTAGVKIPPQNQRIWQWLKDNGPHSVRDLSVELSIGEATVQAAVSIMLRRKMLERIARHDHKMIRLNNHYGALGRVFELLPEPILKRPRPPMMSMPKVEVAAEPVSLATLIQDVVKFNPYEFVETLSIKDARELYAYLGKMFK